jgi:HlyD family secretion protein
MNVINKKSIQTISILLLVVAAGYGFSSMQEQDQSDFDPDTMPLFRVSKGPLTISISESGTIRPRDQVILRNDMWEDSTILSIVDEGTRVKKRRSDL